MIELTSRASISDHMLFNSIDADYLEKRIKSEIASGFANKLIESKEFQNNIVKRDKNFDAYHYGETIYETTMVLITPEEAKEFKKLREFQNQMKFFVK